LVGYQILNEESRFKFEAAFLFTKYFGPACLFGGRSPLGQAFTTRFFCDKKSQKIAQTNRSILNANPIGAWPPFLLFSKKS
jgi:hypothetical protein